MGCWSVALLSIVLPAGGSVWAQTSGAILEGRVRNGTTNQPAAGVLVEYIQLQQGMTPVGAATTDAQGQFQLENLPLGASSAPALLRAHYKGATYSQPLIPGQTPLGGLEILVYEASSDKSLISLREHVIFLEPVGDALNVYERILIENPSSPPQAYVNPQGTYLFSLPGKPREEVKGSIQGSAGMPIPQTPEARAGENQFAITYPIRPGESSIALEYSLDYQSPFEFTKNVDQPAQQTFFVIPGEGVELSGDTLESQGKEPSTSSAIYHVSRMEQPLKVTVSGQAPASTSTTAVEGGLIPIPDPVSQRRWIVFGALGVVMLAGFFYLYRL
jgi:hypothetical protein